MKVPKNHNFEAKKRKGRNRENKSKTVKQVIKSSKVVLKDNKRTWSYFLEHIGNKNYRIVEIPGIVDSITSKYLFDILQIPGELDRILDRHKQNLPIILPKEFEGRLQEFSQEIAKFING